MELVFDVREEDGILVAICENPDMATQGRTMEELIGMVRDLIQCHFDEGDARRNAKPVFTLHEQRVPAGADDIGLDAIRLDIEHGAREAPADQTP